MPKGLNKDAKFSPWERQICEMLFVKKMTRKEIIEELQTSGAMFATLMNRAMKKAGARTFWEMYPLFCPKDFETVQAVKT